MNSLEMISQNQVIELLDYVRIFIVLGINDKWLYIQSKNIRTNNCQTFCFIASFNYMFSL